MTKIRLSLVGAAMTTLLVSIGPASAQEAMPIPASENIVMSDLMDESGDFLAFGPVDGGPPGGPPPVGPGGPGGPGPWAAMMHGHRGMGGGPLGSLQGPLAISDEQYERLYAIKSQFDDTLGPKKLQMKTLGRHLCEALASSNIDTSKVKELQGQLTSLITETSRMHGDKLLAYAQVLSGEQRKAIHDAMIKRSLGGELGGMGMGKHGGPHCH